MSKQFHRRILSKTDDNDKAWTSALNEIVMYKKTQVKDVGLLLMLSFTKQLQLKMIHLKIVIN